MELYYMSVLAVAFIIIIFTVMVGVLDYFKYERDREGVLNR